jgi:hypothetical protein
LGGHGGGIFGSHLYIIIKRAVILLGLPPCTKACWRGRQRCFLPELINMKAL